VAYHSHLAAEARYVDQEALREPVGVSTFYPDRPHDPYAMEVLLGRSDQRLRWFDGRRALVFPAAGTARLLVPGILAFDPVLEDLVAPYARPLPSIQLYPTDFVTRVEVLEWEAGAALGAALQGGDGSVGVFPDATLPTDGVYHPLSLPVVLGESLALVGYRVTPPSVAAGEALTVVTWWQVNAGEEDLVLFTHMLDADGRVVAQDDRLDAPAWNWHAGDAFAQVHRLRVPTDAPLGRYHLQVGAYRPGTAVRLPVRVGGESVDDRILLQPVEVTAP
jgi:hypothetical protein